MDQFFGSERKFAEKPVLTTELSVDSRIVRYFPDERTTSGRSVPLNLNVDAIIVCARSSRLILHRATKYSNLLQDSRFRNTTICSVRVEDFDDIVSFFGVDSRDGQNDSAVWGWRHQAIDYVQVVGIRLWKVGRCDLNKLYYMSA